MEAIQTMAQFWYAEWYRKDVKPKLTTEQKDAVMRRTSKLTLEAPIWLDRETNFIEQFPELEPYSHNKKISGLQLCTVMEEIFKELQPMYNAIWDSRNEPLHSALEGNRRQVTR